MGLLESVIAGILSRVVYDEATAWSPKLSRILLKLAVNTMPKLQRDRCREEWQSWTDECSGHMSKIVAALGFLVMAQRTNVCNVWKSLRVLLEPVHYERGYLAGLLAAYEFIVVKCELTAPVRLTKSVATVSLYYIVQMRMRRVLNVALGNDNHDGIGKLAFCALQINLEVALSGLKNK